jgi:COPII coat assembly protein SEC16
MSASFQPDPQDVNVAEESHVVESLSSVYEPNPEESGSTSTDTSAAPNAPTFEAPPSHSSLEQSLTGDQLSITSADLDRPSFSPPPLTGSPVEYSQTPQPTTGAGPQNGFANGFADDRAPYNPYAPAHHSRQNSDASHTGSTYSNARVVSPIPRDPYAPPKPSTLPRKDSVASSIHGSYGPSSFVAVADHSQGPYAPTTGLQRVQSRQSQHSCDDEYPSRYNYTHDPGLSTTDGRSNPTADPDAVGYSNVLATPTYAPYAPSPSLLGTNDPLGRASARVPVISFGFGGKLVACFHSAGETASGFDVSLTSRQSTSVQLRTLHEIIPASAMDSFASSYPGPLFSDPGASSLSLARTVGVGAANNVKAKKALVSTWLAERSEELSRGVAHVPSGSQERYNAEGKLVLVRLLKVMIDNDGQLSGR